MTAEIDITRQLKLPVFDPEFNRRGRVDSRSQNVRKLPPPRPLRIDDPEPRQPPPGILRSQTSSPATPASPSGSVTSSWTSSSTTSTLTPSILSTSSTTAPSKRTVSFPDNDEYQAQNQLPQMSKRKGNRNRRSTSRGSQVDESNNRTAAAAAPSTGSRDDERRIKRAPIRKWKSLSAADAQQQQQQHDQVPVGVRARLQRLRCQSEVDADSRQTRAAPQSSTSPSKTKASDAEACRYRPSNYARFKYPVKYHRVAEPGQPDLRSRSLLVTATFQMPPCFRRPTPSYWMPVRQGQTSDDGPTGQRQRTANKQESAQTKQENAENKTKQRSGGKTDKTRGSLNGVYHVVHGDQTAGDLNRPGSRAESEPQTAVEQVKNFSEYGSSLPSGDESDEDRYDSDVTKDVNRSKFRGKPPAVSDSGTAADSLVIARRSESDDDDSDENNDSQEDSENYRDDFDLAADEDDADDHSSSDEK